MLYTLKIKLAGSSKPPIWRKVQVNSNISFYDLHFVIQGVFEWYNTHIFSFSPGLYEAPPALVFTNENDPYKEEISEKEIWPHGDKFDASEIELYNYFKDLPKSKINYLYDYGDDWMHEVVLEAATEGIILYPKCISGKGKAPIEDCGGIPGFYHMVEVINTGPKAERQEFLDWLGLNKKFKWDVNEFDLKSTNERLMEIWMGLKARS